MGLGLLFVFVLDVFFFGCVCLLCRSEWEHYVVHL